jgi:hypothetical protein
MKARILRGHLWLLAQRSTPPTAALIGCTAAGLLLAYGLAARNLVALVLGLQAVAWTVLANDQWGLRSGRASLPFAAAAWVWIVTLGLIPFIADATYSPYSPPTPCRAVAASTSRADGEGVVITASADGCDHAEYRFFLKFPDQDHWQPLRDWGEDTFIWRADTAAPGLYWFGVWTRAAGAHTDNAESSTSLAYRHRLPPRCAGVVVRAEPTEAQPVATLVHLTASALGCATADFQWWVLPPGEGQTYQVLRDWGEGTFTWALTDLPTGLYSLVVYARTAGSSDEGPETTGVLTYWYGPALPSPAVNPGE